MNVLICDDDLKIVQQIKNFLLKLSKQSTYNFDITCFSNGDFILDKQIKTDFAFIDIEMPGVNGLTVTKHLQKINPNIIIFIVTSFQGYQMMQWISMFLGFCLNPLTKIDFLGA